MVNSMAGLSILSNQYSSLSSRIIEGKMAQAIFTGAEILVKSAQSSPTDIISLHEPEMDKLLDKFQKITKNAIDNVPNDIVFSKTIPLKDIIISLTDDENDTIFYRISLYGYEKIVDSLMEGDDTDKVVVGYMMVTDEPDVSSGQGWSKYIYTSKTSSKLFFDKTIGVENGMPAASVLHSGIKHIGEVMQTVLALWYCSNILLLHPAVKKVCKRTRTESVSISSKTHKEKKPMKKVIKYVKRIEIDVDAIENIFHEKRKYEKRNPYFYVTGHWRRYKSGKEIWVDGYWKGELREIKMKESEIRKREIIIPTETERHPS